VQCKILCRSDNRCAKIVGNIINAFVLVLKLAWSLLYLCIWKNFWVKCIIELAKEIGQGLMYPLVVDKIVKSKNCRMWMVEMRCDMMTFWLKIKKQYMVYQKVKSLETIIFNVFERNLFCSREQYNIVKYCYSLK